MRSATGYTLTIFSHGILFSFLRFTGIQLQSSILEEKAYGIELS